MAYVSMTIYIIIIVSDERYYIRLPYNVFRNVGGASLWAK